MPGDPRRTSHTPVMFGRKCGGYFLSALSELDVLFSGPDDAVLELSPDFESDEDDLVVPFPPDFRA